VEGKNPEILPALKIFADGRPGPTASRTSSVESIWLGHGVPPGVKISLIVCFGMVYLPWHARKSVVFMWREGLFPDRRIWG